MQDLQTALFQGLQTGFFRYYKLEYVLINGLFVLPRQPTVVYWRLHTTNIGVVIYKFTTNLSLISQRHYLPLSTFQHNLPTVAKYD